MLLVWSQRIVGQLLNRNNKNTVHNTTLTLLQTVIYTIVLDLQKTFTLYHSPGLKNISQTLSPYTLIYHFSLFFNPPLVWSFDFTQEPTQLDISSYFRKFLVKMLFCIRLWMVWQQTYISIDYCKLWNESLPLRTIFFINNTLVNHFHNL